MRDKSGLLIETPSQILDLGKYPEQNREDVQAYIRQYLTPLTPLAKGGTRIEESLANGGTRIQKSLAKGGISIEESLANGGTSIEESLAKEGTRIEESLANGGTGEESSNRISPPLLRGAGGDLKSWLTTHNLSEQEFCDSSRE